MTVLPPGNLTFRIQRVGSTWIADIWTGTWSGIGLVSTTWNVAAEIEAGQEILAVNGDLNTINAPVNLIQKIKVGGTGNSNRPWSNLSLVAPLQGTSLYLPAGNPTPLKVMDGSLEDFTSMSSHNIH